MKQIDRLMIIDDDEVVIFLAKLVINQFSSIKNIDSYTKPEEAYNDLKNGTVALPDIILLDLNMPIMDGWEFLDLLKDEHLITQVPIVILTSSIDPADKKKSSLYSNVIDFISKPLSQSKLEELIAKLSK
ncbi:MAG: response regulator [Flavobacteriales bacterium]